MLIRARPRLSNPTGLDHVKLNQLRFSLGWIILYWHWA